MSSAPAEHSPASSAGGAAEWSVYTLAPKSAFNLGPRGHGAQRRLGLFPSDSLFSALCTQLRELRGRAALERLLDEFIAGDPPFLVSGLFPRLGPVQLLPRPATPPAAHGSEANGRLDYRTFTQLEWLSWSEFERWVGDAMEPDGAMPQAAPQGRHNPAGRRRAPSGGRRASAGSPGTGGRRHCVAARAARADRHGPRWTRRACLHAIHHQLCARHAAVSVYCVAARRLARGTRTDSGCARRWRPRRRPRRRTWVLRSRKRRDPAGPAATGREWTRDLRPALPYAPRSWRPACSPIATLPGHSWNGAVAPDHPKPPASDAGA